MRIKLFKTVPKDWFLYPDIIQLKNKFFEKNISQLINSPNSKSWDFDNLPVQKLRKRLYSEQYSQFKSTIKSKPTVKRRHRKSLSYTQLSTMIISENSFEVDNIINTVDDELFFYYLDCYLDGYLLNYTN